MQGPAGGRAAPERINRERGRLCQGRGAGAAPAGEAVGERTRAAAVADGVSGWDRCPWLRPWNRCASHTGERDSHPRQGVDDQELVGLFLWDEATFLARTEGSAIRRAGFERWLRNLAVALGNGPASQRALSALQQRRAHPSALVREHVEWALARLNPAIEIRKGFVAD